MEPQNQPAPTVTTPSQPAAAAVPAVPSTWPGAFGLLKHSKTAMRKNLGTILALVGISIVASIVCQALLGRDTGKSLAQLVSLILLTPFTITLLASAREESVSLDSAFKADVKTYFFVALNYILVALLLLVSFIALVVPFFFVLPRLLLSTYFVVDQNMSPVDAIKASWDATKDHVGMMYGIIGASIAFALLVITIIGIPFAIYFLFMYSAAYAIAYLYLKGQQPNQPAAETVSPPTLPTDTPATPQGPTSQSV